MKIKVAVPLQDRVVVERLDTSDDDAFLHTPEKAKEKPVQGRVVKVGPGKLLENGSIVPVAVKRGDVVLFAKYGGTDVDLGPGQEYLILREDEIMAVVVEEDDNIIEPVDASVDVTP